MYSGSHLRLLMFIPAHYILSVTESGSNFLSSLSLRKLIKRCKMLKTNIFKTHSILLPNIDVCLMLQEEQGTLAVLSVDGHVKQSLSIGHSVVDRSP